MKREHIIRLVAGSLVLLGLLLAVSKSYWWLLLPMLVGLNLVQSAFTKWCLLERFLEKYNIGKGCCEPHDKGCC